MTVLTRPVEPGRDAAAGPGQVPWRGMLWVTWRQHRAVLIGVPALFTAAVAFMLVTGPKMHHDYAILAACHPAASPACAPLSNYFNSTDWHYGNGLRVALLAAPALLAMFAGPPVIARELENGTFRYAWTQGIGRVHWTVAKLAFLGSMVTDPGAGDQPAVHLVLRPVPGGGELARARPAGVRHPGPLVRGLDADRVLPRRVPRHALPARPPRHGRHAGGLRRARRGDLVLPARPLPGQHVLAHAGLRRPAGCCSCPGCSSRLLSGWSAATPPRLLRRR